MKLGLILIPATFFAGCASTSDMDELKASIATAQSSADGAAETAQLGLTAAEDAQKTADSALSAANKATTTAQGAQKTADRALNAVDAQNIKINRMFEKSMSK